MTTWIISASVLLAAVILLRLALRGRIAPRLQYALWGLVLLRLLLPVSLGAAPFSVLNALPSQSASGQAAPAVTAPVLLPDRTQEDLQGTAQPVAGADPQPAAQQAQGGQSLARSLALLWLAGVLGVGLCFGAANFHFARSLRRSRRPVEGLQAGLPVYVTEAADSPCLFGLFRPAIYVTPEALADPLVLRHVLAHEYTHFRQGDHLWALLRGVAVALHWYNPLVWWAAVLSRRDGEAACDAGTIRRLGEGERAAYGRTLIGMTCRGRAGLLTTATTMTGSARALRERVSLLAKSPRTKPCTALLLALLMLAAAGCTFTGEAAARQVPIQHAFSEEVPEAAVTAAQRLVTQWVQTYDQGFQVTDPNCSIAEAKITALTPISTGAAGLEDGMAMYRLEYRLRVKGQLKEGTLATLETETINGKTWLTENNTLSGAPYLFLYYYDQAGETTWLDAGVLYEHSLPKYDTLELRQQYGNPYTAAAMERYTRYHSAERAVPLSLAPGVDAPNEVISYTESILQQQISVIRGRWAEAGLDCTITAAEISHLNHVNTGTASNEEAIDMYSMECVFWVDGKEEDVLQAGLRRENDNPRYAEDEHAYTWDGKLLPILYCQGDERWIPIGVATGETLAQYSTDEMLQKYGNPYTAAAMELYALYKDEAAA